MFENKMWANADSDLTLQHIVDNAKKLMNAVRGPMPANTDEDDFLASIFAEIIVFKNSKPLTIANGGISVDLITGNVVLTEVPQDSDVISCQYPYCATEAMKIKKLQKDKNSLKRPYYNKNRW
jgi:hypothetical protein